VITPPKRSGIARVLKGISQFYLQSSLSEWTIHAFAFLVT